MNETRLDVVGFPIGHSKSPLIHEAVLDEITPSYRYRKVSLEKGHLAEYLSQVKSEHINGFNLTMPHKQDIIPFLDFIDDEAKLLHSVNTVKVKDGKLFGYNTDSKGMLCSMAEIGIFPKGKNVSLLGAGGVARTAALKLTLEGANQIDIFNRSLSAANEIFEDVFNITQKKIFAHQLNLADLADALTDCDILINCTPLGMQGFDCDFEDLSFLNSLKKESLVFDLIYNPPETNLLKAAHSLGLKTLNGFGMLIYQALLADEIFLEQSIDFNYFKEKIENKLKKF